MKRVLDYIAARLSVISERGVTLVEYGLIATLIAVMITVATIGSINVVGQKLINTVNTIANSLERPAPPCRQSQAETQCAEDQNHH